MKYFIITGTSKGLGEALALRLLKEGNTLFCSSRKRNENLIKSANEKNVAIHYFEKDLSSTEGIKEIMDQIFNVVDLENTEHISFINNAGIISPIKQFGKLTEKEIIENVNINLISPMIITNYFMSKLANFKGDKRIINISSGAGKKPVPSWGSYCVSKAGIDMITQVIASEEKEDGLKVISFAPGVMDTNLQIDVRSTNSDDFEMLDTFNGLKENGKLLDANYVAEKVESLLFTNEFEQGALKNVSDYN